MATVQLIAAYLLAIIYLVNIIFDLITQSVYYSRIKKRYHGTLEADCTSRPNAANCSEAEYDFYRRLWWLYFLLTMLLFPLTVILTYGLYDIKPKFLLTWIISASFLFVVDIWLYVIVFRSGEFDAPNFVGIVLSLATIVVVTVNLIDFIPRAAERNSSENYAL